LVKDADAAKYIMTFGTAGGGNDQEKNSCNIAKSHAYSVLAAFELEISGTKHELLLARNPWGVTYYNKEFDKNDAVWNTQANLDKVPLKINPKTSDAQGIFVIPIKKMLAASSCIADIQIAHVQDPKVYKDSFLDIEGSKAADDTSVKHTFTAPEFAAGDKMYVTVESYYNNMMPKQCYSNSKTYPDLYWEVRKEGTRVSYQWYDEQFSRPILLTTWAKGNAMEVNVKYSWFNHPAKDYTIKITSKHSIDIKDAAGKNYITNYDGT